jgi:hypothetical protein
MDARSTNRPGEDTQPLAVGTATRSAEGLPDGRLVAETY